MFTAINIIAERKIEEAIRDNRVNIDNWRGKPLPREDNSFVPEDLKMAYKMLKNAGYLPPEIEIKKEIQKIEELLAATDDEHVRVKQLKKLDVLSNKLDNLRNRPLNLTEYDEYHRKVTEKITLNK